MKKINIRTNLNDLSFVRDFFLEHRINITFYDLDSHEKRIVSVGGLNIADQLLNYCVYEKEDTVSIYLINFDSNEKYIASRPTSLPDAHDGFSLRNSAVVSGLYIENILHELLHAVVDAQDCYVKPTSESVHEDCDETCCVMRFGNRNGLKVCLRVLNKIDEFVNS